MSTVSVSVSPSAVEYATDLIRKDQSCLSTAAPIWGRFNFEHDGVSARDHSSGAARKCVMRIAISLVRTVV
jgi:hypothetical protein